MVMIKEIEITIIGYVQAVSFRNFTQKNACELGLFGIVQNMSDGSVKIIAQGKKEKLKKFIEAVKKGPVFSKVENVKIKWRKPAKKILDFKIIY